MLTRSASLIDRALGWDVILYEFSQPDQPIGLLKVHGKIQASRDDLLMFETFGMSLIH